MEKPSGKDITMGKVLDTAHTSFEMCSASFFFFCLFLSQWLFLLACLLSVKAWGSSTRVPRASRAVARVGDAGAVSWACTLPGTTSLCPAAVPMVGGRGPGPGDCSHISPSGHRLGVMDLSLGSLHAARRIFPPLSRLDYVLSFLPKCRIEAKYRL